ncbi:endoplasmic oxidoreductin [Mollisia scopiformis]|uniref:Cyclin-dependent kinases regulatory subunit n=1 Tax=Mollisia scopiformis TaxID=149040 RepID=A0A194XW24_MOLSC|nr:endoplasmic oxidoreductin [Mollisia scopiformis]KUJ24336.1 endoplasmic oxidoreductin [Mollisia scopiformis]
MDYNRRNKVPRQLTDAEKARLEEFIDAIHYSSRYSDNEYEYRHVQLPKNMLKAIPKEYHDPSKGTLKLLWEEEWRGLGITQSLGWEHYEVHEPEPHILLFKSAFAKSPVAQLPFACLSNAYNQISPKAIVSDACASYSTLDQLNKELRPSLSDITKNTDFFAYYRLNLFGKECPFWNDNNGMCGNIACAVNTLDNEEDIPPVWRAEELGKLEGPKAGHPGKRLQEERGPVKPLQGMLGQDVGESCVVEYDDECDERDYCVPEDEGSGSKGDYVSLVDNPERFTGYAGEGTKQVWDAIYRENCFSKSSFPKSASLGTLSTSQKGAAVNELQNVIREHGRQQVLEEVREHTPNAPFVTETGLEHEDQCLEKRVFYRVVSGMHTSISTHLCWEYLNQTTGEWGPNLQCYKERLHDFPDRISNLYFNYALVLRAVTKLGPYLKDYTFCSGDPQQDRDTKAKVQALSSKAGTVPQIFDESLMFVNGEGPSLKEDFRNRFRNVSRIMDCVGCDKCRLWGKLQTAGYGAALKVLFEFDNDSKDIPMLKRTELVALFNTLARISSSLEAINSFRIMVEEEQVEEVQRLPDRILKPHHVIPGKEFSESEGDVPAVEDDGSAEFEEEQFYRTRLPQNATIMDEFKAELDLMWRVTKYVVRGWISAPKKAWEIFSLEASRAWNSYIGLPVGPRRWVIKRPRLDEL